MRLIDADAFKAKGRELYGQAGWDVREVHYSQLDTECNIDYMPTIEVQEVRHGRWKWEGFNIECSECGCMPQFDSTEPLYNYCPNCGAKMEEDKMTTSDGYTIEQYPKKNVIVITLPQRLDTIQSTIVPVSDRRKQLSDVEEAALLVAVKAMFENGTKMDEVEE